MQRKTLAIRIAGMALMWPFLGPAATGFANDGTYSLDAGGLTRVQADNIAMESEDLRVSFSRIDVRYRFRNLDDREKDILIGFPMPHPAGLPRDADGPGEPGVKRMLASFRTEVDGAAIEPDGVEVAVTGYIPPDPKFSWQRPLERRLFKIGPALKAEGIDLMASDLSVRKLLGDEDLRARLARTVSETSDPDWRPNFAYLEMVPYWRQTVAANAVLAIAHSYRPEPGNELFASFTVQGADGAPAPLSAEDRANGISRLRSDAEWATKSLHEIYGENAVVTCSLTTDEDFAAPIERWHERRARRPRDDDPPVCEEGEATMQLDRLTYILTTARTWTGPIGRFVLTVDGEGEPALFCFPGQIEVVDAGRFLYRIEIENFEPRHELTVYRAR